MNMLRAYWHWAVSALLIAAAIALGAVLTINIVDTSFYRSRVSDGAGVLSAQAKEAIFSENKSLDRARGCIIGVVTAEADGAIADYAEKTFTDDHFGQNDLLLTLYPAERQWYLSYGDRFALYSSNELLQIVSAAAEGGLFDAPDENLPKLHETLSTWAMTHLPESGAELSREKPMSGASFLLVLLSFIVPLAAAAAIIRFAVIPLKLRKKPNG